MTLNDIIDINLLGRFWTNVKTYFNELFSSKEDKATIVNHGTNDTTFALTPNVLHTWGTINSLTLSLASGSSTYVDGYWFKFTAGSSFTTLTMPSGVNWVTEPDIEAGKTYEVMIVDSLASYVTDGISDTIKAKTRMINHGTSTTTYELGPNEYHVWGEVSSLNLTLREESTGYVNGYWFRFTSGSTPTVVTLPSSIKWYHDEGLEVDANKTYEVTIVEGYACYTAYTSPNNLATKQWVETQTVPAIISVGGTALTAISNAIYTFNSNVTSLAVTLPAIASQSKAQILSIFFTTGVSPSITFVSADGTPVLYYDGFSFDDNTMYEVNAMYNGSSWVIGNCVISAT